MGNSNNDAHDVAAQAATTTALDANASDLIYGKYAVDQTYPALPPAPDGYETRPVQGSDGAPGYKYVTAGTPRERSAGGQTSSRAVYVRLHQNKGTQKGTTSSRLVFDTPCDHDTEIVVFNRNSVPTLVNSWQLGPRAVITQKNQRAYLIGDNLLIACAIASRAQAIKVSALAAKAKDIRYEGTGFIKDGVNLEDFLSNPKLLADTLAYASPGGDGYNGRLAYYSNDSTAWGSDDANGRIAVVSKWLEGEADRLGYNPQVIKDQINIQISLLDDAGISVPNQLKALVS